MFSVIIIIIIIIVVVVVVVIVVGPNIFKYGRGHFINDKLRSETVKRLKCYERKYAICDYMYLLYLDFIKFCYSVCEKRKH